MPKPDPAQAEEEGLCLLQGQGAAYRLQGHRPAAEVHLRPRQDPRPPGDRQLPPASARRRGRGEERPRGRAAALHLDGALSGGHREAHPHRRRAEPRRARRHGRGQGRLRPQLPAAPQAGRSWPPAARRSRSPRSAGPSRRARSATSATRRRSPRRLPVCLGDRAGPRGRRQRSAVRLGVPPPTSSTRCAPRAAPPWTGGPSKCPARSRRSAAIRSQYGCTPRSPPS